MTKEQFAAMLNGRQYGSELTDREASDAKAAGLVIVYGYSDDNMELRGAFDDEIGCWEGRRFNIDQEGIMPEWPNGEERKKEDAIEYFRRHYGKTWPTIHALWCVEKDFSWTYKTNLPHATFEIMEDGDKFCRGIVFNISDVMPIGSATQ